MKKYSLIILLSIFSYWGSAQNMCKTTGRFPSRTENALRVAQNATSNSCPYLVRVYFHIVRNSNGTGGQSTGVLSSIMNNLNVTFGTHGISFQNTGNDEIKNDTYMSAFSNTGPTNPKYVQLIATNVISNSINIYLLPDNHPTWTGGLANGFGNSGGTAFVIGGNISFPGSGVQNMVPSKVLSHEMGHCLGLYHTFEELLCREKVDGSNCSTCGDLVCDTPAESPFYAFAENASCAYTTSTTDENGATYSPILSNIMNYVRPSCMNVFTGGQGYRMRNAIALDPAIALTVASTVFYTGGVYSYGNSTFAINSSTTNI
jgi:hypothetical protein